MRWYERPHDGAHDTEVIAEVTLASGSVGAPSADAGDGSSVRIVVGRWDGNSWIIWRQGQRRARESRTEKTYLNRAGGAAPSGDDLTPVSVLTPRDAPPAVCLAVPEPGAGRRGGVALLEILLEGLGDEGRRGGVGR
jgi:hypothetical protein